MPNGTDPSMEDYPTPEPEMPAEPGAEAPEDMESDGESSALLPKSLVGEVQPGDTVTLKVLHVYEDEYEVAPVESGDGPGTPMDEAESGLDRMARPGIGSPGMPVES